MGGDDKIEAAFTFAFVVFMGGFICAPYFWTEGESAGSPLERLGFILMVSSTGVIALVATSKWCWDRWHASAGPRRYRGHDDL